MRNTLLHRGAYFLCVTAGVSVFVMAVALLILAIKAT